MSIQFSLSTCVYLGILNVCSNMYIYKHYTSSIHIKHIDINIWHAHLRADMQSTIGTSAADVFKWAWHLGSHYIDIYIYDIYLLQTYRSRVAPVVHVQQSPSNGSGTSGHITYIYIYTWQTFPATIQITSSTSAKDIFKRAWHLHRYIYIYDIHLLQTFKAVPKILQWIWSSYIARPKLSSVQIWSDSFERIRKNTRFVNRTTKRIVWWAAVGGWQAGWTFRSMDST